jgi:hypothetical protein
VLSQTKATHPGRARQASYIKSNEGEAAVKEVIELALLKQWVVTNQTLRLEPTV